MNWILPGDVDEGLLALGRRHPALQQAGGVRIDSAGEDAVRAGDRRRAFRCIDDLDRRALLLVLHDVVVAAIDHYRPLTERDLLRRIDRRLDLQDLLFRELLEVAPAKHLHHLVGRRHDGARVARMPLDQLADPLRLQQVDEAFRHVGRCDELGVDADHAEVEPHRDGVAIGITVVRGIVRRNLIRHERGEPAVALPGQHMRRIRGIDDVDVADARRHLLADALEQPLAARTLDADGDAGMFRLEHLGPLLGNDQIHRRVPVDLGFLAGGLDQRRRDADGGRRRRQHACWPGAEQSTRAHEDLATV